MRERTFRWLTVLGFAALTAVTMLRHEFWRDEVGIWLAARALPDFGDYLHVLEFGGHGRLWHVALWLLARLTDDPLSMQLLQLAAATAAAYVVVRWAPFPRWARAAFCFGYFPLFEFGVLARPYGLQLLLTVCACAVFSARPRRPLGLAVVLGLLCWTTIYGAITACAIALAWLVDARRAAADGTAPLPSRRVAGCAAAVFLAGLGCGLVQMAPHPDASYAAGIRFGGDHALEALGAVFRGLVPVPPPVVSFRNATLLSGVSHGAPIVGAALLVWVLRQLRHNPAGLTLFASGAAAHLLFTWLKFSGAIRHHGALYLLLVAACWIDPPAASAGAGPARTRTRLLALLLGAHVYAGLYAVTVDAIRPFSMSAAVARFVRGGPYADLPVVAAPTSRTMPVIHTLGRPLYFADRGAFMTYQYFSRTWATTDAPDPFAAAADLATDRGTDVLVLLADADLQVPAGAEELARFEGAIEITEQYRLYLHRR